jgi:hypothetical protein
VDAWVWILIVVVAALVVAAVAYKLGRRQRSEGLRERFGPEYERTVAERGQRSAAESELSQRERRREQLDITPLSSEARERYATSWRETQTRFVDEPSEAVQQADELVRRVMGERGYPVESFDQQESDISVDHPGVVRDYRAAHGISLANNHGQASTEDLRQAMVHYRSLFDDLLGSGGDSSARTA